MGLHDGIMSGQRFKLLRQKQSCDYIGKSPNKKKKEEEAHFVIRWSKR
jgi:hypothetical protein